ncbi:MAG TPA: type II toxin-antitoxin system VapC family toxin [Solirubrobacterales bacterium]|nr:type II toxin-antitoxin system VapC family toxin [Solirubrobacterales bacterium]
MNEVVLDASVVLKWFHGEGERNVEAAREIRGRYEAGDLYVLAPPLLWLELINVAARSWRWSGKQLDDLAAALPQLGFEIVQPGLPRLASWAAAGLTAYDAAYLTVAEEAGVQLVTDDAEIVRAAPETAIPLGV